MQPEAAAHVVEDQRGPGGVAQRAQAAGEPGIDKLLVVACVMLERADQDARQVVARLRGGLPHAVEVVVGVVAEVGAVLRGDPGRPGRAPGRGAVVGAGSDEDLAPPGPGPGDGAAHGGGVGAVLGEHRPVRVPHGPHEQLGEVHHDRARGVLAVGERGLRGHGLLHPGVLVAEHDRPVAAHQVDVLVPVHVPDPRAAPAAHELRVGGGKQRGRLVPVHPAGDHRPRALPQLLVHGALCRFAGLLSHGPAPFPVLVAHVRYVEGILDGRPIKKQVSR